MKTQKIILLPALIAVIALSLVSCSEKQQDNHTMGSKDHDNKTESASHEMHQDKPTEATKSPRTSAMAMTGGNHIHIDYSAPSARGRQIFGGLVAYDEVWVTGAHKATNIKFDKDVIINGEVIKAGQYGLFTIPGKDEWTVIINQDWDMHLSDDYISSNDLMRFNVKPEILSETVEVLTFNTEEKNSNTTKVSISWDKTRVSFDIVNVES